MGGCDEKRKWSVPTISCFLTSKDLLPGKIGWIFFLYYTTEFFAVEYNQKQRIAGLQETGLQESDFAVCGFEERASSTELVVKDKADK